jgi:phosphoglycerate dehydrogenase-like enzyme
VVDQRALTLALREGWIAGAGLDVMETEPAPLDEPLRSQPNVILTPHAAFYSDAAFLRAKRQVADTVIAALTGHRPPNLLNPQVWKD